MTLLFLAFAFWIGYLGVEALSLRRWRRAIPLRITVTGTRGKTSVARMAAAILRADGRRVLVKTTGSQPRYILSDGTERAVRRRGVPSILEQIQLLRLGAREGVQVVVAEIMSLHRENHLVESRKILQPHLVLVTNFRVDHTEAAGWTREEVATLHLADIPAGSTVMIPEAEVVPGFAEAVEELGASLVQVVMPKEGSSGAGAAFPGAGAAAPGAGPPPPAATPPFLAENLVLARRAARELEIPEEAVIRGLREARGDLGAHWLRRYRPSGAYRAALETPGSSRASTAPDARPSSHPDTALTVNAFAANDPQSTGLLLDWARGEAWSRGRRGNTEHGVAPDPAGSGARGEAWAPEVIDSHASPRKVIGILNLRADRGDRTAQWLEAMAGGFRQRFHRLYVAGFHASAFRRGLGRRGLGDGVVVLRETDPARAMARILAESDDREPLLFGFGNFGGLGEAMAAHWLEWSEGIGPVGRHDTEGAASNGEGPGPGDEGPVSTSGGSGADPGGPGPERPHPHHPEEGAHGS